jgi:hypothetical protein
MHWRIPIVGVLALFVSCTGVSQSSEYLHCS